MRALIMVLLGSIAAAQTPAAPSAKTGDADGKKIFTAKCVICHAKDGKGSPTMAKMFNAPPQVLDLTSEAAQKQSDADLTKIVSAGLRKMPPFKDKLKDAEIADVVAFVRTLRAKPPVAGQPAKTDAKSNATESKKP